MTPAFKILDILLKQGKVGFCLQAQTPHSYYNISIDDPKGRNHSFSSKNFSEVETFLTTMWGHLLTPVKTENLPHPMLNVLPKPTGLPRPF